MATFNGVDLGIVTEWHTAAAPVERQVNTYPGVNGLQVLKGGTRGGRTRLRGLISAATPAALDSDIGTFNTMVQDGGAYSLVNDNGTTWTSVTLLTFDTEGQKQDSGTRYMMEFLHLGP